MKTIVVYTSNTGYTKQYAQMLADELGCQAIARKQIGQVDLNDFQRIIYGGGIRANNISGFKSMLKNLKKLHDKEIVIFAVGATGKSDENTASILEKNITEHHADYPFFYLHGGFDPDRLSPMMRYLLKKMEKSIKKKEAKNPDGLDQGDKDFLDFFQTPHMNVNKENLVELIDHVTNH